MANKFSILIVEEEQRLSFLLAQELERAGYDTTCTSNLQDGLALFKTQSFQLVIGEVALAGTPKYACLTEIQAISIVPVVLLIEKPRESERIQAFEQGVDDLIEKPFNIQELKLRVKRLLYYYYELPNSALTGEEDQLRLDEKNKRLYIEGKFVRLSAIEFSLMHYFMQFPDRIITREELLQEVWHYEYGGQIRTVDAQVRRLRKKIEGYSVDAAKAIKTIRSQGYLYQSE